MLVWLEVQHAQNAEQCCDLRTAASAENGDKEQFQVHLVQCRRASRDFASNAAFLGFKLAVQPEIWPRNQHLSV
jgi:sugar diacid utilization regulator